MADPTISHGWTTSEPDDPTKDVSADVMNDHQITGFSAAVDARIAAAATSTDARTPTGAAGGVLGGTYPNPSFAVDMATQAELDAHAAAGDPHPGYTTAAELIAYAQPLDSDLTAIALLTTTAYGRAFLALADAAAGRSALALVIGTDVQGYDADLAAIAGLTSAADKLPYFTGSAAAALADLTTFARSLLDDANAGAARTTLGLGTAAVAATGDFDAAGAASAAQAASQPLDSDLTTIGAIAPTNDDIIQRKAGAWVNRTMAQLLTDLGIAGSYQPLDSDLTAIAALSTTSYGRSVLEAANAAALRTLAGLVIGTDVRAQGSGDPTRSSLGVDTGDSPQFAGVNVGHASDTTIGRVSAGVLSVEGNRIFAVGGADVPVADGGTGASDAATARTNLGLVIDTDVAAAVHASRHKSGGADAIKLDELAAPTDVTTLDASTSAHGLLKKLPGGTTTFLRGDGTFAVPSGPSLFPSCDQVYTQAATNGTSHSQTITAVATGKRIVFVVNSRGRDHNTPTCTNVTFTKMVGAAFSTTNYTTIWVGVATGTSGTTITVTATGSNWLITDTYILSDALTPTAGNTATLTNTSASTQALIPIGPIAVSVGDFIVAAASQDDGTTALATIVAGSYLVSAPRGAGAALISGVGRAGSASVSAWYTGGTAGSDMAAAIVGIT